MHRTIALVALAVALTGCTRFGTRANGPFSSKPRTDPMAAIPPGPLANSSPLVLGTHLQPLSPTTPDDNRVIPNRVPEPVALGNGFIGPNGEVVPAGGPPEDGAFPPFRRRPEPRPNQLPSPFAPKGDPLPNVPMPKLPMPMAPAGGPPPARVNDLAEIKKLVEFASEKWAKVDTYECTALRRELTPTKEMVEDATVYQYRKEPMAVFMRTTSDPGKGREMIYNPSKYGDKIYVMLGEGDSKLLRPGFKAPPVSPDSGIVKEKSRYSIREAGHGTPIKRVAGWVEKIEAGKVPAENLKFLGPMDRKEYPHPLVGVELTLRPGDELLMPNGGTRRWFFDTKPESPACGFPVLIIATEPNGKEVEYYLIEKVKTNVKFADMDFSPDRFGKK